MADVFVDTSYFKALIDQGDEFHTRAIHSLDELRNQELVTTNYILDETFTLIRQRCGLQTTRELQRLLAEFGSQIRLVRVMVIDEKNAWDWFWKDWSKLSFTDCVSFAVMKRLNLQKVATFDEHFERAGFEVLNK